VTLSAKIPLNRQFAAPATVNSRAFEYLLILQDGEPPRSCSSNAAAAAHGFECRYLRH